MAVLSITAIVEIAYRHGMHHLHHSYCGNGQSTVILDAGLGDWLLLLVDLQQWVTAFAQSVIYDRAGYGWSDPAPAAPANSWLLQDCDASST